MFHDGSTGGGVVWFRILDEASTGEGDGVYGDVDVDPSPSITNMVPSNTGSYKLQVVTNSITGAENTFMSDLANLLVNESAL